VADADLEVDVVDVPPEPPGWKARALRWRRPRGELGRGPFAAAVKEATDQADVVHLDGVDTSWCDHGVAAPSLLHLHYLAHADRPFGAPWRRPFREVLEFTLGERAGARRHHFLLANSPVVAARLRRIAPRADVTLASLTLDPGAYPPAALDGPPSVGIIGTASWPPTEAAMHRLVHQVWPRVRDRAPEARLIVAGRGVDRLGLAGPGVEVVGEVASAAEFVGSLSVLAYPVPRGSGMKVKALEAIASGVPVITTACGAEGIVPNDGVVIAEDDAELAAAVVEVLVDEAARRQRGGAARAAFLAHHSPGPATAPLVDLYQRMVSRT
jgi:glycosyltransferase involved in cell wall biosynthesis